MSDLLDAAAAALDLPEALVQRSAEARAAETGASVDDVLSAWAGGGTVDQAATPEPAQPEAAEVAPQEELAPEVAPVATPVTPAVEAPAAAPATQVTARAPVPDEVTSGEAARLPEVVTVPTAGIRERTNFAIPTWLTSVLLIVPLFALLALGGASTGQCGEATELATDVVTGDIVNCDGSEFTGQSVDGGGTDFIALGERIYTGNAVTGVNCAGCHGVGGGGLGTAPGLNGVLTTFGVCVDHVEWVSLGSGGFQAAGRTTYGDTGKTVMGGMPSFSGSLTEEQIAAVSAFERGRFGGGDPETVLVDCGLAETPGEGEDGTSDTTDGGDGSEASAAQTG